MFFVFIFALSHQKGTSKLTGCHNAVMSSPKKKKISVLYLGGLPQNN